MGAGVEGERGAAGARAREGGREGTREGRGHAPGLWAPVLGVLLEEGDATNDGGVVARTAVVKSVVTTTTTSAIRTRAVTARTFRSVASERGQASGAWAPVPVFPPPPGPAAGHGAVQARGVCGRIETDGRGWVQYVRVPGSE